MRAPFVLSSSLAAFIVACGGGPQVPVDQPPLERTTHALGGEDYSSGIEDTGVYGSPQQGRSLTGEAAAPLVGVGYLGATLGGRPVLDVRIVRGRLIGRLPDGQVIERDRWQGAIFRGRRPQGPPLDLMIDAVNSPLTDVDLYTVLRLDHSVSPPVPVPLCAPDLEGNTRALAVAARWNPQTGDRVESDELFTFACRSGVVSKCVGWGYAPWREQERAPAMIKAHQACTRAARADYCGNGQTNTRDGTEIGIFDRLSPQVRQDLGTALEFEGAWDDNGVHCLTHLRWAGLTPECPVNSDPGRPLGPYVRDPQGNIVSPRTCDTPKEATSVDPGVVVFTESVPHSIKDIIDLGAASVVVP